MADITTMNDKYLMHYGVKGMKWGVRRYQNPDGTLTSKGVKRYYGNDSSGNYVLNEKGKKYNKKQSANYERYKNAVSYNVRNVEKEKFNKEFQRYKSLSEKNNLNYLKERQKWFNNSGEYKNKDYYQFKDITRDKYFKTNDWKQEQASRKRLESMVRTAAKESSNYRKTYNKLDDYRYNSLYSSPLSVKKMNYGEQAVKSIMFDIDWEARKDHKSKL